MNTSELLHSIAKDRIDGLITIESYQLRSIVLSVKESVMSIDLKNDLWILNTKQLPQSVTSLEIISSDNVFFVTPGEYDLMDEYRYQVFSDYMDIKTDMDNFQPYRLEFIKIIPHRK